MTDTCTYFSPEVPVLLLGAPGIGKTEKIVSCFDYVEILLLSTCQSEDIGGIPYRVNEFDYRTIPSIFQRIQNAASEGKRTALFLDEIDKSSREVADTLLTLVCHRKVGEAHLPSSTCIIAAANPPEYGGGDGLSIPMLNRFSVIEYEIDPKSWANWARKNFSEFFKDAISAFEEGEIPLFDSCGEGILAKTTSPRSIALAFKAIDRLKGESVKIVEGLLTPAVSQTLISKFDFSTEYKDILDNVNGLDISGLIRVDKKPKMQKKVIKPLEL